MSRIVLTFAAIFCSIGTAILVQVFLNTRVKNMKLCTEQKQQFMRDGYIILQGVIPEKNVQEALAFFDDAVANKRYSTRDNLEEPLPAFYDKVQTDDIVTSMVWKTPLLQALEDLYGTGKVSILGNAGQIAFRPQSKRFVEKGFGLTKPLNNNYWHVDDGPGGKYVKGPASFTVLAGVACSPGQDIDENRGQLNVWPGTSPCLLMSLLPVYLVDNIFLTIIQYLCLHQLRNRVTLDHPSHFMQEVETGKTGCLSNAFWSLSKLPLSL